jgi:hypothetical protein
VYDLDSHRDYVDRFGDEHWDALRPGERLSGRVNYGDYG